MDKAEELLSQFSPTDIQEKLERLQLEQQGLNYNSSEYVTSIKEYSSLSELLDNIKALEKSLMNLNQSKELLKSEEFVDIANDEIKKLELEIIPLVEKISELTRKPLPNDSKKTIMEIRPGVGGNEAALFAEDLFSMYIKYCNIMRFKTEVVSIDYNEEGGIKEAVFLITDENSFSKFRFEGGVHRVQRVPVTEALGRIHTSTASVVVMPKFETSDIKIDPNEIRIDVYRSSGPGGQSVNTTDSAVRIYHIPTKITVTCQNGKSQHKNKEMAMSILMSKLSEMEEEKRSSEENSLRSISINGGDRSSKIRTYNFPQGRITDHRINHSWFNIDVIIEGQADDLITKVNTELRIQLMK